MGSSSGSAPVGAAGVGTTVGMGVAVAFGRETASGSVAGAGSEAVSTDTDCPRPVWVITIKLMPRLTRAKATRVSWWGGCADRPASNQLFFRRYAHRFVAVNR